MKVGDQVGMREGLDCTDNSETPNQENIAFKIVHANSCFWSQLGGVEGAAFCVQRCGDCLEAI
jgi:hypothetical protein